MNWIPNRVKLLKGFEGSEKVVGFSEHKVARIGMETGTFNFDLLNLGQLE